MKNTYEVTEARFIAGQHQKVGAELKLGTAQAKYYLPPHGSGLKLAKPPAKEKPAEKKD